MARYKKKTSTQQIAETTELEPKLRRCSVCGKLKLITYFNYLQKKEGKRMYVCKDCEHESKRAAREHKKSIIEELKAVGCACCGEKDTVCLDFHHYNPSEKEFNLSTALTKPVNKLIEEASKCVVVCSNCHRKIHAGTLNIEDYLSRHEYEYRQKLIRIAFSESFDKTNSSVSNRKLQKLV